MAGLIKLKDGSKPYKLDSLGKLILAWIFLDAIALER